MTFQELAERIEGTEFSVRLGTASLTETFVRGLQAQREVVELYLALRANSDLKYELLEHVDALARREPDVRYENRWDIPLATYIWVLDRVDHSLARLAAERVLSVRNLWWARQVADLVLRQRPAAGTADVLVAMQGVVRQHITQSQDVWDAILSPAIKQTVAHIRRVMEESLLTSTLNQQLLDRGPNGFSVTSSGTTTNVEELVA